MKKYKLTKKTIYHLGTKLYQIEALRDFGGVSKGDKGGYIEKEDNLSQDGNAWVFGNARVFGDARVFGELKLIGGDFYHYKEKSEKIEHIEVDEDYELLASNPVLDESPKEEDLSGEEVEVKIKGKVYKAKII